MPPFVAAGVDGSRESLAAADWAAREALDAGLPLLLVQAWVWPPAGIPDLADNIARYRAERILRDARRRLTERRPTLQISTRQEHTSAVDALLHTAENAELLVLGSRGLSGFTGFLVGSVALATVARAVCPVVLVRARGADSEPQTAAGRGRVVLGLDLARPCDELFAFAFATAARRRAPLLALSAWHPPLPGTHPQEGLRELAGATRMLAAALRPWQEKYPEVPVGDELVTGSPAGHLLRATTGAELVVVGRRTRRPLPGTRLGPVTHAVLHRALCPVAVVPHD